MFLPEAGWKVQSNLYRQGQTVVELLTNGTEQVVRKKVRLNNENRSYAKYELKLMKEITHPHVVKYLHSEQSSDMLHVYMTHYQNLDLEKFLDSHEVQFQTKVKMFIDILAGMMELHSRYIIHRDIKLKNIFIDASQRCVIGDLGIATKSIDSAKSHVGTLCLNAPQVYSNDLYNEKVDIWALGIIAYQLFNRKRNGKIAFPFLSPEQMRPKIIKFGDHVDFQSYMYFTKKVAPLDQDLPEEIKQMIGGMLENKPSKRLSWIEFYQTYHLQKFDTDYRLCTFMAEYKMIEDTKDSLKNYLQFLKDQKQKYFFKLQHILHYQRVDQFKSKYPMIRDNLIDIHIIHFKLMKKTLERYNYIHTKRIYKYILDWKEFSKIVKNEIHPIEQRINYRLSKDKQMEIRTNPNYLDNAYFQKKLALVNQILDSIDSSEFKDIKKL